MMPYIESKSRMTLNHYIEALTACLTAQENLEGRLNYTISSILSGVLKSKGADYESINSLIGVLECAKLELYRRIAAPHENEKIDSNGDVY